MIITIRGCWIYNIYVYIICIYYGLRFFSQAVTAAVSVEGVAFCITLHDYRLDTQTPSWAFMLIIIIVIIYFFIVTTVIFSNSQPTAAATYTCVYLFFYIYKYRYIYILTTQTDCCANFLTIYFYDIRTSLSSSAVRVHTNKRVQLKHPSKDIICTDVSDILFRVHNTVDV